MKPHKLAVAPTKTEPFKYQLLFGGAEYPGDRPWMLHDSWSLELACKLVTLGYPVDLEGSNWESAKNWPLDKFGRHSLIAVRQVFDRARDTALASVAAGKIKDPDTPANWIAWAEGKGYSVAHLGPIITQAPCDCIKPVSRSAAQDDAILEEINRQGHDPLALPKPPAGKGGVKANIRALCLNRKGVFQSKGVFDDAWQRLRDEKKIGDATA